MAMDSLSLHIRRAIKDKQCKPLMICRGIHISHNLFVDDIMIFAKLCRLTWASIHNILKYFQRASGILINEGKSSFYCDDGDTVSKQYLEDCFNIKVNPIKDGVKYLGFYLKPVHYKKFDWMWILDRFHKRIVGWEFKCLSLAGRVGLAQLVLAQMTIYWGHLFFIPLGIISMLNRLMENFIWGGCREKRKYHLTSLRNITLPKELGGWGILDIRTFGKALLCKSLWRGISEVNLWSTFLRNKYMGNKGLIYWYRKGTIGHLHRSAIWLSFKKIESIFLKNLSWIF